jgi:hypothetical protein
MDCEARLPKQSRQESAGDCFASLAMTLKLSLRGVRPKRMTKQSVHPRNDKKERPVKRAPEDKQVALSCHSRLRGNLEQLLPGCPLPAFAGTGFAGITVSREPQEGAALKDAPFCVKISG